MLGPWYSLLKQIHVATVVISLSLFVLRGSWMLAESPRLRQRWVRIIPHVNDTALLLSAIALAAIIHQHPLGNGWLTAKVTALVVYIGLGTVALKRGGTKRVRSIAFAGALITFGYILAVALTRQPLPLAS